MFSKEVVSLSEKDLVEWLIVVNPGLHSAHKVLVGNSSKKGCKFVWCQIQKEETGVKEAVHSNDIVTQKILSDFLFQI